jgi:hypothetical protein
MFLYSRLGLLYIFNLLKVLVSRYYPPYKNCNHPFQNRSVIPVDDYGSRSLFSIRIRIQQLNSSRIRIRNTERVVSNLPVLEQGHSRLYIATKVVAVIFPFLRIPSLSIIHIVKYYFPRIRKCLLFKKLHNVLGLGIDCRL